jgi:hypothetical protein
MCLKVGASDWGGKGGGDTLPLPSGALPRRRAAEAICVRLLEEEATERKAVSPGDRECHRAVPLTFIETTL